MSGSPAPWRGAPLAAGVVAVAAGWSLVPVGVWWAGGQRAYFASAWSQWIWGGAVTLLVAAAALVLSRGRVAAALAQAWRSMERIPAAVFLPGVAILAATLSVVAAVILFDGNPRNVDGFAQLFQARIFLAGRLWAHPPPELANFATLQMILGPDRWYAQYPPGQSLVLAAGLAAGAWWLLNPLLMVVLTLSTWRCARWVAGATVARGSVILLCLSPFVVAIAGSEMSHLAAATLAMAAAACAISRSRPLAGAAGAGLLLGLLTLFRPLDAVAAAVPVGLILALAAARPITSLGMTAVAGMLGTMPTLVWNRVTSGHWTEFGYLTLWGPQHTLGFHEVPWGVALTPLRAVGLTGVDLHQLNVYLLDLPLPVLAIVALGFAAEWRRITRNDAVAVAGVAAVFGLLFFYWHRDVFYGPRLHFGAVPWLLIVTARAVELLVRREAPRLPGVTAGGAAAVVLTSALLIGLVSMLPGRLRAYRDTAPLFRLHPDREARAAGLRRALVLVPDGWGTRLITRLWALGQPVWRTSRLYAAIDACTLEETVRAAEQDPVARGRLGSTLDSLAALGRPGVTVGLTADANLRLPPSPDLLTPACRAELAFDAPGYVQFAPLLYFNTPALDGDIVWARDLGPGNGPLLARYHDRQVWRYAPRAPDAPPVFTRLSADTTGVR